jgi:hypothetical protein
MRNATLTITVENIQLTDEELVGYGTFDNGKDNPAERIMICGYTPRLKDIVTPGQTIVAIGMLRLTKDGLGIPSLTLNINQAMQVTLPASVTV